MKVIFPIIAAGFVLAGCQTTGAQNSLTQPFEVFGQESQQEIKFVKNPQYEKYKNIIKTPLRDFKVYDNFSLVNDQEFDQLMDYHYKYTYGRWPRTEGEHDWAIRNGIDDTKCLDNLKTFTDVSAGVSGPTKNDPHPSVNSKCTNVIHQQFYHNPANISQYKDILLFWAKNDVLKNLNRNANSVGVKKATSVSFAAQNTIGHMLAHYSLYHRGYNLTEEEHNLVEEEIIDFMTTYDAYSKMKKRGPHFVQMCDLSGKRKIMTVNTDYCGTSILHMSVGTTLFGLEFGNQDIYDYGVQHLEIIIATFKDNMYTPQQHRGMKAMGYAREIINEIDKLDYAFQKAFNFDFANMENLHGSTPNGVYVKLKSLAEDPSLFAHLPVTDDRGGDFKKSMKNFLKYGKRSNTQFWEAFNMADYYVFGGALARRNFPEQAKRYQLGGAKFVKAGCCSSKAMLIQESISVGFNSYVLRDATNNW